MVGNPRKMRNGPAVPYSLTRVDRPGVRTWAALGEVREGGTGLTPGARALIRTGAGGGPGTGASGVRRTDGMGGLRRNGEVVLGLSGLLPGRRCRPTVACAPPARLLRKIAGRRPTMKKIESSLQVSHLAPCDRATSPTPPSGRRCARAGRTGRWRTCRAPFPARSRSAPRIGWARPGRPSTRRGQCRHLPATWVSCSAISSASSTEPRLPPLMQAALVHYQFETIRLFLDGSPTLASSTARRSGPRPRIGQPTRRSGVRAPGVNARLVQARLDVTRPAALTVPRQLSKLGILSEVGGGPRGQLPWQAHDVLAALVDDQPAVPVPGAGRRP
jgi:hypothetical protein